MKCPNCGSSMMSIIYGVKEKNDMVRRTRRCTRCDYRFITLEAVVGPVRKYRRKNNG